MIARIRLHGLLAATLVTLFVGERPSIASEPIYRFRQGDVFGYHVSLTIDAPDGTTERYVGPVIFTVRSSDSRSTIMDTWGILECSSWPIGSKMHRVSIGKSVAVDELGRRVSMKEAWHKDYGHRLPWLLGSPLQLIFGPLPGKSGRLDESSAVVVQKIDHPFMPFPKEYEARQRVVLGTESVNATVTRITTEYSVWTTKAQTRGKPWVEMNLKSATEMDTQLGRPSAIRAIATFFRREENDTTKVPITYAVRMLTTAELESAKKKAEVHAQEKVKAEAAAGETYKDLRTPVTPTGRYLSEDVVVKAGMVVLAQDGANRKWYLAEVKEVFADKRVQIAFRDSKREWDQISDRRQLQYPPEHLAAGKSPRPDQTERFDSERRSKILQTLRSGRDEDIKKEAEWLRATRPKQPDEVIAAALAGRLARCDDGTTATAIAGALRYWYTPAVIPTIVKYVRSDEYNVFSPAIQCLEYIGPAVEREVQPLLRSRDETVRQKACQLMRKVGTTQSLPELDRIANADADPNVKRSAASAAAMIRGRGR